jgi:hypothetical protein
MASSRKEEVLTSLTDGIAALTTSAQWETWLRAQSRFHHYSFNNVILIQIQDPDATRVAGFHTWKALGRSVRKGEKAIWILAPMTRKVAAEDAEQADETKPGARVLSGFKPVPVFDIHQTDGEPLPEVSSRLQGDEPGVYTQLIAVARSIGYTVEEDYLTAAPTVTAASPSGGSASSFATMPGSRSRRSRTSWPTRCCTRTSTAVHWLSWRPNPWRSLSAPTSALTAVTTRSGMSPRGLGEPKRPSPTSRRRAHASRPPQTASSERSTRPRSALHDRRVARVPWYTLKRGPWRQAMTDGPTSESRPTARA